VTAPSDLLDVTLSARLEALRAEGRFKEEVVITGRQSAEPRTVNGPMLNFRANNYLGLATHPAVLDGAIGEETRAGQLASAIRRRGVMVVAFSHPVVSRGKARIRVQTSAEHSQSDLETVVTAFRAAAEEL
jgi:7-keto-8-aminopelargonate synthetase-like enzyme